MIECDEDECENVATHNVQSGLKFWLVDKKENYKLDKNFDFETDDMVNDHLCDEHFQIRYE